MVAATPIATSQMAPVRWRAGRAGRVAHIRGAGVRPARGRLKWVTLSACLSAVGTVEETLRWLGVEAYRAPAP